MKETVKASIGGYAFTIDADAYEVLNAYLDNLKAYFEKKNDGNEILTDIEYRMSELLRMKANSPTDIVTISDAEHIIEIMGNPADFDDPEEVNENLPESKEPVITSKKKESKKLYRDTDHAILGGVCSGLGHYFNMDAVLVRIIYAFGFIATIASNKISFFDKLGFFIFISYFVLWIVMPAAKTFNQKLEMLGQDPSIKDIETGNFKIKKVHGSGIGKVLGKIFKIFVVLILVLISITVLSTAFFFFFFPSVIDFPSARDFLETNGLFTYNVVSSITLLWLIPTLMIIYLAIRLLMKFNIKDVLVLGAAFVIWLGVCGYVINWGVKFSKNYKQKATYTEKYTPDIQYDTIYIKLSDRYKYAENVFDSNQLYMMDEDPRSWLLMPKIEIIKDTLYKDIQIDIKKKAFDRSWQTAKDRAEKANFPIHESGNRLILEPHLYNKNKLWDREVFELIIYCPFNKEIVLDQILKYNTKETNKINNSN